LIEINFIIKKYKKFILKSELKMKSSISVKVLPTIVLNPGDIYPFTSTPIKNNFNYYQTSTSNLVRPNHYTQKRYSSATTSVLRSQNNDFKFWTPYIPSSTLEHSKKKNNYNTSSYLNGNSHNNNFHYLNYPVKTNKPKRYYSTENHNNFDLSKLFDENSNSTNGVTYYDLKTSKAINNKNTTYFSPINYYKSNTPRIVHPEFSTKKLAPQKTISNIYDNYTNYNSEILSSNKHSYNYSDSNIILNSLTNNSNYNYISSPYSNSSSYNIYNNTTYGELEPNSNFKLSDFITLYKIGEGTEGLINAVSWIKNNKVYALKRCEIIFSEAAKQRKQLNEYIKNLINTTGCNGIIKVYGNIYTSNRFGTYYFYELMEKADKDWEQEISSRNNNNLYYQEYELMNIFKHLIKIFSLLQSNHFTHRDIKPQNIMIVNGVLKICDFGNAKLLKREGIIIQKIRGSELFLSPIAFKGLHNGLQTIKHNTFKSDVFSLGMCFFYAATLTYGALNSIREVYDMNIIKKIVNKFLGKRYSQKLINLILAMLQVDERKRPDFLQLDLLTY